MTEDKVKKVRMTLDLHPHQLDGLRAMAKSYGYTIGRGPMAREGSVQKLVEALVDIPEGCDMPALAIIAVSPEWMEEAWDEEDSTEEYFDWLASLLDDLEALDVPEEVIDRIRDLAII